MFLALIAGLFDLTQLVNLLSIGTLLAYSVVAISITILRYMDNSDTLGTQVTIAENGHANGNGNTNNTHANGHNLSESSLLTSKGERMTFKSVLRQLFNLRRVEVPTELSTIIVGSLITVFCKPAFLYNPLRVGINCPPTVHFRFPFNRHWFDIYAGL